jgi:hypothetical protein
VIIYDALERATAAAAADQPALMAARAAWERLAGVVHDDEPLFEERAAAFLEWFMVDYRGDSGTLRPPIDALIARAPDERERAALAAIASSHRSLYLVAETQPDGVLLEDLWGGATFRVHERRRLAGLGPRELFDARLVADIDDPPALLFARTFCFHPREALAPAREQVARARRAGEPCETLLFRLLRMRVRCERYRHVSPARVYAAEDTQSALRGD